MGSKSRNTTTTQRLDPAAEAYRNRAYAAAQSASQNITDNPLYSGPRTAGPSDGLTDTYNQSRQLAGAIPGVMDAYQSQVGGIGTAADVFSGAAGGFGQALNQYGSQSRFSNLGLGMLGSQYNARDPYAMAGASAAGALGTGLDGLGRAGAGSDAGMAALMAQAGGAGAGINALRGSLAPGSTMANLDSFSNPYTDQVINRVNADYGRQADMTSMGIRDAATRANAFGGSRAAITEGAALGELGRGQADTIAGLRASGFTDAANRAAADSASRIGVANNLASYGGLAGNQLSNLGLSAAGQQVGAGFSGIGMGSDAYNRTQDRNANIASTYLNQGNMANAAMADYGYRGASDLGAYGQNALSNVSNLGLGGMTGAANYGNQLSAYQQADYDAQRAAYGERDARTMNALGAYSSMLGAPTGTSTTTPQQRNVGAGILGGAASGFSMFGPWGALGGAILGGLG